ncbi:ABC transporter permease [Thermanaerothrix sp. 4228-RoL]|uniref:ABC transporter permease n=2 Tax=Thermanaerothrix TaxID=1077886 RepID=A0ABU3NNM9_9CHLR|nr:ABC transporter permease [Thermanaerothrix sp. 4228-RoL]MDT8898447.1 ABC transporter permease [Thermanaerothrix sp. 4228-RoL]
MGVFERALLYALSRPTEFWQAVGQHVLLTISAVLIALMIALPLGVGTARSRWMSLTVINTVNALRVIPSLAVLFLVIPYFGLSATAAVVALTLLAIPPILLNTDAAFRSLEPGLIEAARGMGMSSLQILRRVEFPLALPVILTGVRTAAILAIAIATIGSKFGAGGLGTLLFEGIAQAGRMDKVWAGALGVATLALAFNYGLLWLERQLTPYRAVETT